MTEAQKTQISIAKHTWIAMVINLIIAPLFYIHTSSVWLGLPFITLCYYGFEFIQKKMFNGKNGWKQQFVTVFISMLSYAIYAVLLTVDFK